jgi:hypothetical protein
MYQRQVRHDPAVADRGPVGHELHPGGAHRGDPLGQRRQHQQREEGGVEHGQDASRTEERGEGGQQVLRLPDDVHADLGAAVGGFQLVVVAGVVVGGQFGRHGGA